MEKIFPGRQRNDSARANHLAAPRNGSSTQRRDVGVLLRALQYQAKPIEVREAQKIIARENFRIIEVFRSDLETESSRMAKLPEIAVTHSAIQPEWRRVGAVTVI